MASSDGVRASAEARAAALAGFRLLETIGGGCRGPRAWAAVSETMTLTRGSWVGYITEATEDDAMDSCYTVEDGWESEMMLCLGGRELAGVVGFGAHGVRCSAPISEEVAAGAAAAHSAGGRFERRQGRPGSQPKRRLRAPAATVAGALTCFVPPGLRQPQPEGDLDLRVCAAAGESPEHKGRRRRGAVHVQSVPVCAPVPLRPLRPSPSLCSEPSVRRSVRRPAVRPVCGRGDEDDLTTVNSLPTRGRSGRQSYGSLCRDFARDVALFPSRCLR